MRLIGFIMVLFVVVSIVAAQEEQEFVTETSCSLSLKTTALPVDSSDRSGSVGIEGLLTDNKGSPIEGQRIQITASNGTFTCMPPVRFSSAEVSSSAESCLNTQEDGTFKIYLVNIPFNRPGTVKAFCTYGSFRVSAFCSYSITKYKKSAAKKSSYPIKPKKKIPISGEL